MIPSNWFSKKEIEKEIPVEFYNIIKKTKEQKTKIKAIKYAYNEISKKYWGGI